MRESKECLECGGIYFRPPGYTLSMWEARRYCGQVCAGKGIAAGRKEANKAVVEGELRLAQAAKSEPPEVEEQADKEPLMRELRIVRVGPNPRMLVCEYYELASRRLCRVLVKRTTKFVKGMRLVMAEPREQSAYERPWVYEGPPPRHRGRW